MHRSKRSKQGRGTSIFAAALSVTTGADVVIVGAGPAGAATALLLARAGHDVLLVDRHQFPRAKPCGDCLSAGATALLERMGLLDAVRAAPHALLDGWRIVSPSGRAFEARFDDAPAISIERRILDDIVLAAALRAGAAFVRDRIDDVIAHGSRITGVRSRTTHYHARLVIGADGLRSVIAARIGMRARPGALRKLSLTFHLDQSLVDDAFGEMHVGDGICAGVAPLGGGRTNVTVVADSRRFGRRFATDPVGAAADALERLPLMQGRVGAADLRAAPVQASGPFDRAVPRIAADGAVLVGDSAGYYDPFTGQGVFQALACAELLAPCVQHALRSGKPVARDFARYVAARARLLRGPRMVQRGIEAVLSRPRLADRAIRRIGRAPAFARAIIAVTGDVEAPSSLLSPRALSSLIAPPTETRA